MPASIRERMALAPYRSCKYRTFPVWSKCAWEQSTYFGTRPLPSSRFTSPARSSLAYPVSISTMSRSFSL